ncbi:MAG: MFS transporter [Burkholderiales bacterium]|jgi:1-acyl-sn-glycerol-3-phosphate acyltransferase
MNHSQSDIIPPHPTSSQFALLGERRFAAFFWTQFLGAGNDNIFKFAFTVLATYQAASWGGLDPKLAGPVIGALFILPFVLFSATAGQLADKYDKAPLTKLVKDLEIAFMVVIAAGFIWHLPTLLFLGVFLMGCHSTLFGPVKFAYLPQHLHDTELTGGNGMIEMGTFTAILLGSMAGGFLVKLGDSGVLWVAGVSLFVAVLGRVTAHFVPASPPPDPGLKVNWNPVTETWRNLKIAHRNPTVFHSLIGNSWFWFMGSIFLTSLTGFAKEVLGGDELVVLLLMGLFTAGIGIGCMLCEKLSGHKIEIGLVPFGSIGMTVFSIDLYFASRGLAPSGALSGVGSFVSQWSNVRVMADLFFMAMFAGFYSVPLYAMMQARAEPDYRARIIAANNILNALFMVLASVMAALLMKSGLSLPELYLVVGIMNFAVAAYIFLLIPEFLMRFLVWMLIHTTYRVKEEGQMHIPDEGPCVLVCNHVSFVDALVIGGCIRRPVRFVMDHRIFKIPVLNFIFRTAGTIPIASAKEDPVMLERAYERIDAYLKAGEVVCIFPEGRITDNGDLYPFKQGIMRIIEKSPVPVVPMALRGLWGSFFSRWGGAAMRYPRGVSSSIGFVVDQPIAPSLVTPELLQQKVALLRGDWK